MVHNQPMSNTSEATVHDAIACLQRLTDLFQERRVQLAGVVGLTEQQWSVLEEISTEHFMPSLFARRRESSAAAVSKILRQLLEKDLVKVGLGAADGRQRHYELSAKGKRCVETLRKERQAAIRSVWHDLAEGELKVFTRFGNNLAERLAGYAAKVKERD